MPNSAVSRTLSKRIDDDIANTRQEELQKFEAWINDRNKERENLGLSPLSEEVTALHRSRFLSEKKQSLPHHTLANVTGEPWEQVNLTQPKIEVSAIEHEAEFQAWIHQRNEEREAFGLPPLAKDAIAIHRSRFQPEVHVYAIDYDIAIARQEELEKFQAWIDHCNEEREECGLPPLSEAFITAKRIQFLLYHNQSLIKHIQANVATHPKDIHKLVSFSNRGSHQIDEINRNAHAFDTGSCFDFMPSLAEACGVDFEPIFMADVFAGLPFGRTFECATSPDAKDHPQCPMDGKKITTTLLHIGYFTNSFPESRVHYYPYDDSAIRDPNSDEVSQILETNHAYFTKYPSLLPETAQTTYYHYAGDKYPPQALYECQGMGDIDPAYKETIKRMACVSAGFPLNYNWQGPWPVRQIGTHTLHPRDFRASPNTVTPLSVFSTNGASSSNPYLSAGNSRRNSSSSTSMMEEEVVSEWVRPVDQKPPVSGG